MSRVYKRRQQQYITTMPSPLDFYAFIFHFPGIFGGPTLFYHEYHDVIGSDKYAAGFPAARYLPALRKFLVGAVSLGLYVVATATFPVEYLLGDALYAKALPVRHLEDQREHLRGERLRQRGGEGPRDLGRMFQRGDRGV